MYLEKLILTFGVIIEVMYHILAYERSENWKRSDSLFPAQYTRI